MKQPNYLPEVKSQYEDYPYPERDPENEKHNLHTPFTDCLDQINHYCFKGNRDFQKDFRVLVAGGGTGDSVIFLAEQLQDTAAEVVYLDMSEASMNVAKSRASIRGLNNITWVQGSLLDIPALDIGTFDFINCTGVLHHLENPEQGLSVLNNVLNDDGAMTIMVYATYGRTAVYQIQALMRFVNSNESDANAKVENCKTIINSLPEKHWYKMFARMYPDDNISSDIELYDLFLHSQDRAYTIPELYEYIENEGLNILHLFAYGQDEGNGLYDPASYIHDEHILDNIRKLSKVRQQAIAELMNGGILMHTFYAARDTDREASINDLDNIPFLNIFLALESYKSIYEAVKDASGMVGIQLGDKAIYFNKTTHAEGIFKYLDGNITLRDIFSKIIASPKYKKSKPTNISLRNEFTEIYASFQKYNFMLLRNKAIKYPKTTRDMKKRVMDMYT